MNGILLPSSGPPRGRGGERIPPWEAVKSRVDSDGVPLSHLEVAHAAMAGDVREETWKMPRTKVKNQ